MPKLNLPLTPDQAELLLKVLRLHYSVDLTTRQTQQFARKHDGTYARKPTPHQLKVLRELTSRLASQIEAAPPSTKTSIPEASREASQNHPQQLKSQQEIEDEFKTIFKD